MQKVMTYKSNNERYIYSKNEQTFSAFTFPHQKLDKPKYFSGAMEIKPEIQ
jgi:hypothetical protein